MKRMQQRYGVVAYFVSEQLSVACRSSRRKPAHVHSTVVNLRCDHVTWCFAWCCYTHTIAVTISSSLKSFSLSLLLHYRVISVRYNSVIVICVVGGTIRQVQGGHESEALKATHREVCSERITVVQLHGCSMKIEERSL